MKNNGLLSGLLGISFLVLVFASASVSAYVLDGRKWGDSAMGTGATVTYSYAPTGVSCAATWEPAGCVNTTINSVFSGAEAAIDAAFTAWSSVANISFIKVADGGGAFGIGSIGDIRIGAHYFDGHAGTLAHGYYPPNNGGAWAGDIHFDSDDTWKDTWGGSGFNIFQVATHEIGHAIGLRHETDVSALLNPYYSEAVHGLQQDDIDGAQYIYGPAEQIPEPVTLALMGIGLLGVGFSRHRLQ
ncbi:MAG: matrixin family metalloprotease [Gammaproteobacteria bacterium]|nr:matrixin family metalloprotease [Gammaproteobacteria bacterium]